MTKEKLRPCAFFDGSRKKTEKAQKRQSVKETSVFFYGKTGIFPYGPGKDAVFLP